MPRPKLSRISKKKVRAPYTREAVEVEQEAPQKSPTEIIADEMVEMRKALVAGTANPTHLESIAQAMAVVAEHVANIGDIRPPGPIDVEALAAKVDDALARIHVHEKSIENVANKVAEILSKPPRLLSRVEALETEYGKLRVMSADLKEGLNEVAEVAGAAPVQPAPANGVEAPKKKRGRPSNAELAAREAAKQTPVLPKPEAMHGSADGFPGEDFPSAPVEETKPAAQAAPHASLEDEERAIQAFIESKPGVKVSEVMKQFKVSFNRATAYVETWGKPAEILAETPKAVVDAAVNAEDDAVRREMQAQRDAAKPTPAAQATVDVPKAATPTAIPTLDEVRATAITYAGKHTKEGLGKVLAKYGSDRLSGVPEEQRAALHAELLKGV